MYYSLARDSSQRRGNLFAFFDLIRLCRETSPQGHEVATSTPVCFAHDPSLAPPSSVCCWKGHSVSASPCPEILRAGLCDANADQDLVLADSRGRGNYVFMHFVQFWYVWLLLVCSQHHPVSSRLGLAAVELTPPHHKGPGGGGVPKNMFESGLRGLWWFTE